MSSTTLASNARYDILTVLRTRSLKTETLASEVGIKSASVRRSIQELRRGGHNIVYKAGFATLVEPVETAGTTSAL